MFEPITKGNCDIPRVTDYFVLWEHIKVIYFKHVLRVHTCPYMFGLHVGKQ
jgi:hypothetical protein